MFENFADDAPKRASTSCRPVNQQSVDLCPAHGDNQFNFLRIGRDRRIALAGINPDEFLSGIGTGGKLETFPDRAGRQAQTEFLAQFPVRRCVVIFTGAQMTGGAGIKTTRESIFGHRTFLDEQFAVTIKDEDMHSPVAETAGMHCRPGRLPNDPVLLVYDVEDFVGHYAPVVSFASGFRFWYGCCVSVMKNSVQIKIMRLLVSSIFLTSLVTGASAGVLTPIDPHKQADVSGQTVEMNTVQFGSVPQKFQTMPVAPISGKMVDRSQTVATKNVETNIRDFPTVPSKILPMTNFTVKRASLDKLPVETEIVATSDVKTDKAKINSRVIRPLTPAGHQELKDQINKIP